MSLQQQFSRREFLGTISLAAVGLAGCSRQPIPAGVEQVQPTAPEGITAYSHIGCSLSPAVRDFYATVNRVSTSAAEGNGLSRKCYDIISQRLSKVEQAAAKLQTLAGQEHESVGEIVDLSSGSFLGLADRLAALMQNTTELKDKTCKLMAKAEQQDLQPGMVKAYALEVANCRAYLRWCGEMVQPESQATAISVPDSPAAAKNLLRPDK